jgi:LytS/YehU family sensor histidine kinase
VTVRAGRRNGALRIEMFNSGRLAEPVEPGIGITNTVARLQPLYGSDHPFELRGEPGGVTADVTIPSSPP